MDRRLLWFLAFIGISVAGNALADTNLAQPDTSVDGLLDLILNQSGHWSQRLYGYAINLFWLLATIQLVWTFMPLVLKQADIGEIAGELVRFILVTGFFLAMIFFLLFFTIFLMDFLTAFSILAVRIALLVVNTFFTAAVSFSFNTLPSFFFMI